MSDALLSASLHLAAAALCRHSHGLLILRLPLRSGARVAYSPLCTSFSPARVPRGAAGSTTAWSGVEEGQAEDDAPASIELTPVATEEQFERVVAEAQQLEQPVVFLWMANWCRKCIYLKPKLEKLAAEYYPRPLCPLVLSIILHRIRFYCVDVNTVPQRLVTRAGITKMPTLQLWKDGQKQAEVIGGHKAWLVIDDVRRMIENEE